MTQLTLGLTRDCDQTATGPTEFGPFSLINKVVEKRVAMGVGRAARDESIMLL
jgi:hypothetical protein